jgi:hypothetical protein
MSQLPPQAIQEFQALWKKYCGEELTLEEANTKAHDVFLVLKLALTKPSKPAKPNPSEYSRRHDTPNNATTI